MVQSLDAGLYDLIIRPNENSKGSVLKYLFSWIKNCTRFCKVSYTIQSVTPAVSQTVQADSTKFTFIVNIDK